MNYAEIARRFDHQDMPLEAAWAYEIAITDTRSDLALHLDLAALYFTASDTGYAATHHLSQEFADVAYDRGMAILADAQRRFGANAEIEFWRLYLREHVLGELVPREAYLKLAFTNETRLPYLALYVASAGQEFSSEVAPLRHSVRLGRTARERYIKSLAG